MDRGPIRNRDDSKVCRLAQGDGGTPMTQQFDEDRVHALLERLLVLPRAQRRAALDDACAGDPALRQRIEHLLALADDNEGFLDRSPTGDLPPMVTAGSAYAAGRSIGPYRLLRCLGTGGTAEVWLAERVEGGFHQQVAIKLIAHAPGRVGARFNVERGILASLNHPGIARLYDGGIEPGGLAYMVMEYVEGEHLVAWCRAHRLPLAERLALFLQVCDAVAYAHTRLVVHRDIKPANILVSADGQAKLLDFGIAKLLDDAPTAGVPAGQATATVQLSPAYAAPEQLSGELIGTPTDVYALGITLFELLAERLPWAGETTSLATAMRRLLDGQVPLPSRAATAESPIPRRALRGDLDAIVARTLRREPEQRYPDARALADDIRRHLEHRPVQARAGARSYVTRRYLRRHWRALALTAAVFLAMSGALVAVTWQAKKARLAAQRAEAVQSFMVDLFRANSSNQPDPVKARQTTARQLLDIGARRIETDLGDAPENKLALLRLFGDLYNEFALPASQVSVRTQAVALSRQLHGPDSPELATDLIVLAGVESSLDQDAANIHLAEARSILDRRGDARSFLRGQLLATSANNSYTSDPKRARDEAGQAVEILGGYPDSIELAHALSTQGMADIVLGDIAQAVAPLQRAVAGMVRAKAIHDPNLSIYCRQLAQAASLAKQYDVAIAAASDAIKYARSEGAENNYDLVRGETSMAEALVYADRPRDALEVAAKAKADAPVVGQDADAGILRNYAFAIAGRAQVRAGAPEAALADAEDALATIRAVKRNDSYLAATLGVNAEVLTELNPDQAQRPLEEAIQIRKRIGAKPIDTYTLMYIRIALDTGRIAEARQAFAALPSLSGDALSMTANGIRRALADADIDLAEGKFDDAAKAASDAVARARASELAPYLRSAISDGELLEGLARVRSGDAGGARPLLADALALRTALYLPQSPRIAEAQLALAECALALGRRDEAAGLVAQAGTIEKQHSVLSPRYRRPLERLRAQLEKR